MQSQSSRGERIHNVPADLGGAPGAECPGAGGGGDGDGGRGRASSAIIILTPFRRRGAKVRRPGGATGGEG